jgi:dipeptidyl aminopeptidase/acylaminoacyl peptidase
MEKSKKVLGIFVISILVILGIVFFLRKEAKDAIIDTSSSMLLPTPTPVPFEELTIPYLRKKNYDGALLDRSRVSANASYTSYSTSYTSDGIKINAQLTIPTGDMPIGGWPAIVFVHGYIPPTIYQTFSNYIAYVDFLARNDFVVLKIDLRGHGDSEGQASGAYYSSDYIVDTLNAVNALQSVDFVDPAKVGLWGHSMAGNVVLRSLAVKPRIPAAVIWAGAVYTYEDQRKYGIQDNSYRPPVNTTPQQQRRNQLFKIHGQFSKESPFWKQVVATNYLKDIKTAIQLNHAVDDTVVNIGYSRDLDKLLTEAHSTHELHEYSSGGHNISGSNFTPAMQNTVNFFKKYLQ